MHFLREQLARRDGDLKRMEEQLLQREVTVTTLEEPVQGLQRQLQSTNASLASSDAVRTLVQPEHEAAFQSLTQERNQLVAERDSLQSTL